MKSTIVAPKANKVAFNREFHGHTLTDNYRWLRDETEEDPAVRAQIAAEGEYFAAVSTQYQLLQEEIFQEMLVRVQKKDESGDVKESVSAIGKFGYFDYYSKTPVGKTYPIYCRKNIAEKSQEEIVLDFNELAVGHDHFGLNSDNIAYNPNYKYLAFSVDYTGEEFYRQKIFDVENKELLPDDVEKIWDSYWLDDSEYLFLESFKGKTDLLPNQFYMHKVGTPSDQDVLLYKESDESFFINNTLKTPDGKYLFLLALNSFQSETWLLDLTDINSGFKLFSRRQKDHSYLPYLVGDEFFIITNKDNAYNFEIMKTSIDQTDERYWQEYISHREDTVLTEQIMNNCPLQFIDGYLIFQERKNGKINIRIIDLQTDQSSYINLPDPFYYIYDITELEPGSRSIKIGYSSYITPYTEYAYDLVTKELKQTYQNHINGFDKSLYASEKVWATAKDGNKVPISLCYKRDLFKKDGSNPLFLDGYGMSGDPNGEWFDNCRISLMDRGGIFAVPHIRGSGYLGVKWYENGKLLNKTNSFTDYIACAEFMISEKYSEPAKMAAFGRSGGGYLISSVLNRRPDLFRFAFLQVPGVNFLDDLIDADPLYMSFLREELGNPDVKEDFEKLLENCPYYNIRNAPYPFIHVLAGLHDVRTNCWGPLKWIAKVRKHNTSNNPVVIEFRNEGHHGYVTDNYYFDRIYAGYYAVMFSQLNQL